MENADKDRVKGQNGHAAKKKGAIVKKLVARENKKVRGPSSEKVSEMRRRTHLSAFGRIRAFERGVDSGRTR